jgi:hypothetical protein
MHYAAIDKTRADFGDPAAAQRKDTGSTLQVLHNEGINLRYMRSEIAPGIRRIRLMLEQNIRGEPALQVDTRYCPITVRAFQGGYRLEDVKESSRTSDMGLLPVKDGTYDHPMDDIRYGVVNLFGVDGRANGMHMYLKADGQGKVLGPNGFPASLEYNKGLDPA